MPPAKHGVRRGARPWIWVTALLVLSALVSLGRDRIPIPGAGGAVDLEVAGGDGQVLDLFESRRSGDMVEVAGLVEAVLSDDNNGSRHQRFILRMASGHTLLIAHNIDLARRVPLRVGDPVRVRGQYEWNEQGGVLHWTHDDPAGDHAGGWVELEGDRYR
jgi:hypothetical protein